MRELAIAPGDTDSHFADFNDPLIDPGLAPLSAAQALPAAGATLA
jgi:hypothetical protein